MVSFDLNDLKRRVLDALFPDGDPRRGKVLKALIKSITVDNSGHKADIINELFSATWCKENLVVPLEIVHEAGETPGTLLIAIGNFGCLATIGDFIRLRAAQKGYKVQFVEKDSSLIEFLIDEAMASGMGDEGASGPDL